MNSFFVIGILLFSQLLMTVLMDSTYYHLRTVQMLDTTVKDTYLCEGCAVFAQSSFEHDGYIRKIPPQLVSQAKQKDVQIKMCKKEDVAVCTVTVGSMVRIKEIRRSLEDAHSNKLSSSYRP